MYLCAWSTRTYLEDGHGGLLRCLVSTARSEAKYLSEEARRRLEMALREPDRVEAMNRHFDGDRTPAPGRACQLAAIVYQFETLSLRIAEGQDQRLSLAARVNAIMDYVEIFKAFDPPGERIWARYTQRDR